MKQQHGGTILGLIIGIVIGLAVALAVAVYVTKVPVPFMNKGQSRTPEQDVIDRASEEGVLLYAADATTFDVVGQLWELGVRGGRA